MKIVREQTLEIYILIFDINLDTVRQDTVPFSTMNKRKERKGELE